MRTDKKQRDNFVVFTFIRLSIEQIWWWWLVDWWVRNHWNDYRKHSRNSVFHPPIHFSSFFHLADKPQAQQQCRWNYTKNVMFNGYCQRLAMMTNVPIVFNRFMYTLLLPLPLFRSTFVHVRQLLQSVRDHFKYSEMWWLCDTNCRQQQNIAKNSSNQLPIELAVNFQNWGGVLRKKKRHSNTHAHAWNWSIIDVICKFSNHFLYSTAVECYFFELNSHFSFVLRRKRRRITFGKEWKQRNIDNNNNNLCLF